MPKTTNIIIAIPEGKVRDYIDGTIRKDTPEEYVRQTVEKRLVNEHKYPKERIKIEYPVQMGAGKKRADIVIYPDNLTEEEKKRFIIADNVGFGVWDWELVWFWVRGDVL